MNRVMRKRSKAKIYELFTALVFPILDKLEFQSCLLFVLCVLDPPSPNSFIRESVVVCRGVCFCLSGSQFLSVGESVVVCRGVCRGVCCCLSRSMFLSVGESVRESVFVCRGVCCCLSGSLLLSVGESVVSGRLFPNRIY